MALQDCTPRERYDEPRDVYGDKPSRARGAAVSGAIAVVVLTALAIGYFMPGERHEITNAPVGPPPSSQTRSSAETPQDVPKPAQ